MLLALLIPSSASAAPPTVAIDPLITNSITTAHVTGTVDPADNETHFCFETSTDSVNWSGPCYYGSLPAGAGSTAVSQDLTNLKANTEYKVRLTALNFIDPEVFSAEESFTTDPIANTPTLALDPAVPSYTTAHLSGEIDPEGGNEDAVAGAIPIVWELQTSTTGDPGSWGYANGGVIEGSDAEGITPIPVSADPSLNPGTTYHYRLLVAYAGNEYIGGPGEFTTLPVAAPAVTIDPPTSITPTTVHLSGEVDPQGSDPAFDSAWRFEWAIQADFSDALQTKGDTVKGAADEVEADLGKLQPNKTYFVRLKATNAGGTSTSTEPSFKTLTVPPAAETQGAGHLTDTEAVIHGQVNPHNSETEYWFEWGSADCSANPCTAIPIANGATDNSFVHASTTLTGLTASTTYHFRIIAKSAIGETEGTDVSFTTQATPSSCPNSGPGVGFLPDCRAWEMVSPADKLGGDVLPRSERTRAALNGGAVAFTSLGGFSDVRGFGTATEYLSQRDGAPGTSGWSTHGITPVQEGMRILDHLVGGEPKYEGEMSADLDKGVYFGMSPLTADPNVENVFNLYLRDDLRSPGAGSYQLVTGCPLCEETGPFQPNVQNKLGGRKPYLSSASADFGHVVFQSSLPLTMGGNYGSPNAYEFDDGALRLASVLPSGAPAPSAFPGAGVELTHSTHPISSDGSRIVFTAGPYYGYNQDGALFQRIDHTTTIPLNLSERAVPDSPASALYWDAATNGSRVFFTSIESLTEDAPKGNQKLYMWAKQPTDERQSVTIDASGGTFTLIFNENKTAPIDFDASSSQVQSALEALVSVKPGNVTASGGPGSAGAPAPYEVTFSGDFSGANVAELQADNSELTGGASKATVTTTQPVHNLTYLSTDPNGPDLGGGVQGVIGSSDDGQYVYFASAGSNIHEGKLIGGQPPLTHTGGVQLGPERLGIYLWHDDAISYIGQLTGHVDDLKNLWDGGALEYASNAKEAHVTPDGRDLLFRSTSGAGLLSAHGGVDYNQGDYTRGEYAPEYYVYNADTDQLACATCNPSGAPASGETNTMVYPYLGAEMYTSHISHAFTDDGRYVFFSTNERLIPEDTNGTWDAYLYDTVAEEPRLLSSGRSANPSYFMDASADGADVFFTTSQRLSGWDIDGNVDIYDARLGGGFPEPVPPPPGCQGDACQPAPPNLNDPTPASSSYQGSGDQPKVRKTTSRCRKGKRQVKRSGKTRCVRKQSKRDANPNRRAGR